MSLLQTLAVRIIKEQELIIGPLAWHEAEKVSGLTISPEHEVSFVNESPEVVDGLVSQYERLFGRASREACKEAVRDMIGDVPADQLPSSLK